MNWFIVGVIVLFFTVAILTSDYWLDKLFGTHPIHEWDETRQWNDMRQALEVTILDVDVEETPTYHDFRRKREDQA